METNTALLTDARTDRLYSLAIEAGWLALELDDQQLAAVCETFASVVFDQLLDRA